MSYARFSADSDVYVFLNVYGYFDCCACSLTKDSQFNSTDAIITHLKEHLDEGDRVPDRTIPNLERDREENEKFIKEYKEKGFEVS